MLAKISLLLLSLLIPVMVCAQGNLKGTHEFRIAWGSGNSPEYEAFSDPCYISSIPEIDPDEVIATGDRYTSGTLIAEYSYRITPWIDFGVNGGWSMFWQQYNIGMGRKSFFHLMPLMRVNWLRKPRVTIYSTFGAGMELVVRSPVYADKRTSWYGTGQVNYFGITYGKRIIGFFEAGYGSQGYVTVGVGYRIPSL